MKAKEFRENVINSNYRCLMLASLILLVQISAIVTIKHASFMFVINGVIMVIWIIESAIRIDEVLNTKIIDPDEYYYDE